MDLEKGEIKPYTPDNHNLKIFQIRIDYLQATLDFNICFILIQLIFGNKFLFI